MLVLSRELNERIIIGPPGPDQIVITIVQLRNQRVRLGIDAPSSVPVHRDSVCKPVRDGNGKILWYEPTEDKKEKETSRG